MQVMDCYTSMCRTCFLLLIEFRKYLISSITEAAQAREEKGPDCCGILVILLPVMVDVENKKLQSMLIDVFGIFLTTGEDKNGSSNMQMKIPFKFPNTNWKGFIDENSNILSS